MWWGCTDLLAVLEVEFGPWPKVVGCDEAGAGVEGCREKRELERGCWLGVEGNEGDGTGETLNWTGSFPQARSGAG
jgi:hypothetical protein